METTLIIVISILVVIILTIVGVFIAKRLKGSIEIIQEQYNYAPGDTIKGKVVVKLKKAVSSDQLIVGLRCERTERSIMMNTQKSQTRTVVLFDFNQPLEARKEYAPSEYPFNFALKIPSNVTTKIEGLLGSLVSSASMLMGKNDSIRWYLYAELKCSGINLSQKTQVNIA